MAGIIVTERDNSFYVEFNDYDIDIKTGYYDKKSIASIKLQRANDISIALHSNEYYKIPLAMFENFIDKNGASLVPNGSTLTTTNPDGTVTYNTQPQTVVDWIATKAGF